MTTALREAVTEALDAAASARAQHIETALGTGMDVAVLEAWPPGPGALRIIRVPPRALVTVPPGHRCTVYRVSTVHVGRA